ncbi:MAG: hypothetical protein HKN47_12185 [Pirellulaceae bacterium]|nr:hypothetical protein [Pirellulaceae bacterium]
MSKLELQSAKYCSTTDAPSRPAKRTTSRGGKKTIRGFLFRSVLILGIAASVFWFYKHQDPILANIRNNSANYGIFFSNLVRSGDANDMNHFAEQGPEVSPVSLAP